MSAFGKPLAARAGFLACGVHSHFTKSIYIPISIKVALGIVLWSLKVIAWWSLKQRIALYCVFQ